MKRLFLALLFLSVFSTLVTGVTEEEISSALALFPEAHDVAVTLSEEGRIALESAIEVLEMALGVTVLFDHTDEAAYMALSVGLDSKTVVNALSRGYYTLADVFLTEDEAKMAAFTRGQFWGLKSLRMSQTFSEEEVRHGFIDAVNQETDVAALFWTYGNWSRKDEYDKVGAVFRNDPPKLRALIERALDVDPTYAVDAPYRALAAFWSGLPPMPLFEYGQNLPRALSYICPVINEPDYCQACPNCPLVGDADDYFENRLIFAQYYLMEMGLWEDAARVLQSILDEPIGEKYPLYNAYCVQVAQALMDEVVENL